MENNNNNEYPSDYEKEETEDDNSEGEEIASNELKSKSEFLDSKSAKNKTFTYFQIREIENTNAMLMKKVLAHNTRQKQYKTVNHGSKVTSAEINRRKKQRQIDHDNLVLLKKIQSIKPFGLSKVKL